jgi:hypothetical protein
VREDEKLIHIVDQRKMNEGGEEEMEGGVECLSETDSDFEGGDPD